MIKVKKTMVMRSLSSKKDTNRSLKKIKKQKPQTKTRIKSERKTDETKKKQQHKQKVKKTEVEAKEAYGEFSEIEERSDVETAGETDEEHPGHRTTNEEAGSIVLHVGRVEHDMNERE